MNKNSDSDNLSSKQVISSQALIDIEEGSETKDVATCFCGCGKIVKPGRRYICGHHVKHRPMAGNKNGMYGKAPWNKGLTKETDSRVLKNAQGVSRTRKKMAKDGKLVVHNKGKTKDNYMPLKIVSRKTTGINNGMYGKRAWNNGLTKFDNPEKITYGVSKENHWNWREGIACSYGYKWRFIREEVKKRDGYRCAICKTEKDLVVHHKEPYRLTHNHNLSDLITLCRPCHGKVEADIRLGKQVDDIVRPTQRCVETTGNSCSLSDLDSQ